MRRGNKARWVLLGELDRSTDRDDAKPQRMEVREAIRHPQYKPPQHYYDVALLRMTRAVDLNGYVRPACLYTERAISQGRGDPLATGWGHTEWGEWVTRVRIPTPAALFLLQRCRNDSAPHSN